LFVNDDQLVALEEDYDLLFIKEGLKTNVSTLRKYKNKSNEEFHTNSISSGLAIKNITEIVFI